MRTTLMIAAVSMVSALAAPASAQASDQSQAKKARDPNEIVCERQEEIGTRLAGQRVCKTRAQWAEERQSTRADVERAQTQRDLTHPQ